MNSRELVLAVIDHKPVDRVPIVELARAVIGAGFQVIRDNVVVMGSCYRGDMQ